MLPKQRKRDEKASGVVGRVELQLRRSNGHGDGVGNGQRPSPKAHLAQRECRRGSWGASGALGGILLAVVQRQACVSAAEQMATAWSATATVVSEGEGEARNGESRSITGECGHVVARWSPTWPGRAARR